MHAPRYDAPQFPHVNLARIYERQGRVLDALAEWARALDRRPGYRLALEALRHLQQRVN
jgi:hypothetical protein